MSGPNASPSVGQRPSSTDLPSRGTIAAVFSALWFVGWLVTAVALSPVVTSGHPGSPAVIVFFLLLPLGVTLCVGVVTAWAVLLSSPGLASSTRRRAWAAVVTTAALNVVFWVSVFAWHGPGSRPDPSSPTGFDRPSWLSEHPSFVLAVVEVGVAIMLVVRARRLRRGDGAALTTTSGQVGGP